MREPPHQPHLTVSLKMVVTLVSGVRETCWMYLSRRSFSSLRLRPPLEVNLLAGELEPEPELLEELELDLDLDLLLCWPLLQV